jgi:16S rRNA (guanine1516-N2)-methyltransferase
MNDYKLLRVHDCLELHAPTNKNFKPLRIDFVTGKANHRRIFFGKELIAKAVGISKKNLPHVIDATAGLGRDAFVLASLGCEVSLIERSPIIYQLLQDALNRASDHEATEAITGRMKLYHGDAQVLLPTLQADVIYLDPMYPERKKSALVKKEMRILRDINGDDLDADALFAIAMKSDAKRVVVKRPKLAENIAEIPVSFSYSGKHTRFDVYSHKI